MAIMCFIFIIWQALVLLFAVIACAVAIPAALPQPESSPVVGPGAPLVAIEEQQRSALEKRQISSLENEPEPAGDLKASSTYGYGYSINSNAYTYPRS